MIKELIGLFVDDEFLAAAILVIVAAAGVVALAAAPTWIVGVFLTATLPAALAAGVMRTVRRARTGEKVGNADAAALD